MLSKIVADDSLLFLSFFSENIFSEKCRKYQNVITLSLTLVLQNKLRCRTYRTSNFQPIRLFVLNCCYKFTYLMANSADPDQLVSSESGSTVCKGSVYPGSAGQGLSVKKIAGNIFVVYALFMLSFKQVRCAKKIIKQVWSTKQSINANTTDLSQCTTKPTIRPVWPAKTQISLDIHPVWQGFSFIPLWEAVEGTCDQWRLW